MKRAAGLIVIVVGVFWVASVLALGYVGKFSSAEDLTKDFTPTFSDAGQTQLAEDIAISNAFATDFRDKLLPALAAQLGSNAGDLTASLGQQFPAVATGLEQLPGALEFFNNTAKTLADQQGNFHEVAKIPTEDQPATWVPWLFIVPGVIAIGLGLWALIARDGRIGLVAAAVLGALVIVGTVLTDVPQKAEATDDLVEAFEPVFTPEFVAAGRAHVTTTSEFAAQLTEQAIPALASQMQVPPEQFVASLQAQFPTVVTGLEELPDILTRSSALIDTVEDNLETFDDVASIPTADRSATTLTWQFWVPAGILVLVGLVGAFAPVRERKSDAPATEPTAPTEPQS